VIARKRLTALRVGSNTRQLEERVGHISERISICQIASCTVPLEYSSAGLIDEVFDNSVVVPTRPATTIQEYARFRAVTYSVEHYRIVVARMPEADTVPGAKTWSITELFIICPVAPYPICIPFSPAPFVGPSFASQGRCHHGVCNENGIGFQISWTYYTPSR